MLLRFCLAFVLSMAISTSAGAVVDIDTGGKDVNCHLTFTSDFVTDSFAMADKASNKADCLARCQAYAESSVNSMADSDAVTHLEWSCRFPDTQQVFHTTTVKGTP